MKLNVEYMKRHGIEAPESYRHRAVSVDFAESQEIERARPKSFLYQSGYLTIESCEEQELTGRCVSNWLSTESHVSSSLVVGLPI